MITAIIVDDERSNRAFLTTMLVDFCPQVQVVAEADGPAPALEAIQAHDPDLLFLDIEMPTGDAFQLLEQVEDPRFQLIFTTAYDQYAIKAFKFSALDYLLKPIDPDDLVKAVQLAETRIKKSARNANLQVLIDNLSQKDNAPRRIMVPDQSGFVMVRIAEIVRLEAERNYTTFFLDDGKQVVASKSIGHYEELLEGHGFARIHNSHLVNLQKIQKYIKGRGGFVVTTDGAELEVSRRKKDEFLKKLSGP
ncbi:MAG: LytTR family DNA-binding domain-containing protein [Bacteroidota bacterium]